MESDTWNVVPCGKFEGRQQVTLVAVHTAVADQPENMQRLSSRAGMLDCCDECGIGEKTSILNGEVDPGNKLIHNPASAKIEVPNFGIAHLVVWQANVTAATAQRGEWVGLLQPIHRWRPRSTNRIAFVLWPDAPSVENHQHDLWPIHPCFLSHRQR